MFGVRLREHHEFGVGRVTSQRGVIPDEVVDLVAGQGKTQFRIRAGQRGVPVVGQPYDAERRRHMLLEQAYCLLAMREDGLRHAVVQQRREPGQRVGGGRANRQCIADAALDAPHFVEVTGMRDVGGF